MSEEIPQRFGPFVLAKLLHRGGMGELFLARTPWPDSPIAVVKRIRPDLVDVGTFEGRFQHEAELAVRLEHPNIVQTLHVGQVGQQLYVANEPIIGRDAAAISSRLRDRSEGAPVWVAVRLLSDMLAALAYIHGAREPDGRPLNLVHRDVTPGNVLVAYDGAAKLADFGIAKSWLTEDKELTGQGIIVGTPAYIAPEFIRGERPGKPADIYGLGAVTYRLLTGMPPHSGKKDEILMKAVTQHPIRLSSWRPDLPDWFEVFVHRMLEPDPSVRPGDAGELRHELESFAGTRGLLETKRRLGSWLNTLFTDEFNEDLGTIRTILQIDPKGVPEAREQTKVYARHQKDVHLEAPGVAPPTIDKESGEYSGERRLTARLQSEKIESPRVAHGPPSSGDPVRSSVGGLVVLTTVVAMLLTFAITLIVKQPVKEVADMPVPVRLVHERMKENRQLLEQRVLKGHSLKPQAVELMQEATDAFTQKNVTLCNQKLEELERYLKK